MDNPINLDALNAEFDATVLVNGVQLKLIHPAHCAGRDRPRGGLIRWPRALWRLIAGENPVADLRRNLASAVIPSQRHHIRELGASELKMLMLAVDAIHQRWTVETRAKIEIGGAAPRKGGPAGPSPEAMLSASQSFRDNGDRSALEALVKPAAGAQASHAPSPHDPLAAPPHAPRGPQAGENGAVRLRPGGGVLPNGQAWGAARGDQPATEE